MKKAISILCVLATLCLLTGCFRSETSIFTSETEITLLDGDFSETLTVETGKYFQVDSPTKNGYLFLGYFDEETGGEKYIGTDGKTISKWKKGFPTTLYAQWKDIYTLEWQSEKMYSTKANYVGATNVGGPMIKCELPQEMKDAIETNPTKKLEITITCKAYSTSSGSGSPMTFKIYDNNNSGKEAISKSDKIALQSEYSAYNITLYANASDIDNGMFYLNVDNNSTAYLVSMYIKDITIHVEFLEE